MNYMNFMSILVEYMSFDVSWFTTTAGVLVTSGLVFGVIISASFAASWGEFIDAFMSAYEEALESMGNVIAATVDLNIPEDDGTMIAQNEDVESGLFGRYVSVDVSSAEASKTVHLYVISDTENMHTYLNLHDRETQNRLDELTEEQTETLSDLGCLVLCGVYSSTINLSASGIIARLPQVPWSWPMPLMCSITPSLPS